jgi:Fic/DOC family
VLAGFDVGAPLLDPFQRSVYMMFLVAETHPFADGNGGVARIAMNAELVANSQVRIIIPTVLRLNWPLNPEGQGSFEKILFHPELANLAAQLGQLDTLIVPKISTSRASDSFLETQLLRVPSFTPTEQATSPTGRP